MQRALRRSGLPIAYSNGFNPHIVMAFASALSSGIPGDCEILDVQLAADAEEESCLEAMRKALPPALAPSRVRLVDDRFPKPGRLLQRAGYRFAMPAGMAGPVLDSLPSFLEKTEIPAIRKSKTRETLVNIRPMIHSLTGARLENGAGMLDAVVSFTEAETLKPDLLMSALCEYAGAAPDGWRARRTGLFGVLDGQAVPLIDWPWP